jgi:hypothetical protein
MRDGRKWGLNRILFVSGIGMLALFIGATVYLNTRGHDQPYALTIYGDHPERHLIQIKDTQHLIHTYGFNIPGERVALNLDGSYYVLLERKNRELVFMTDELSTLNDFLNANRVG